MRASRPSARPASGHEVQAAASGRRAATRSRGGVFHAPAFRLTRFAGGVQGSEGWELSPAEEESGPREEFTPTDKSSLAEQSGWVTTPPRAAGPQLESLRRELWTHARPAVDDACLHEGGGEGVAEVGRTAGL